MKDPRPDRQQQRRAHGSRQALERGAAAASEPGRPESRDRDRRYRPERRAGHRQHRALGRRDVGAGRRVVRDRDQPADQLRVDEMRDRREQRVHDRVKRRHRELPHRAADRVTDPTKQAADQLAGIRQPQQASPSLARLDRRQQQRQRQHRRANSPQLPSPARDRTPTTGRDPQPTRVVLANRHAY